MLTRPRYVSKKRAFKISGREKIPPKERDGWKPTLVLHLNGFSVFSFFFVLP
jgi:hypothetical protein